jgi:DNA-binding transcriptional MerR regulator
MKNQMDYYLLGDVARTLGCQPYQIVYLLTTGQVPEPRRLGNRRLFKEDDICRIAARLGIRQQVGGRVQ